MTVDKCLDCFCKMVFLAFAPLVCGLQLPDMHSKAGLCLLQTHHVTLSSAWQGGGSHLPCELEPIAYSVRGEGQGPSNSSLCGSHGMVLPPSCCCHSQRAAVELGPWWEFFLCHSSWGLGFLGTRNDQSCTQFSLEFRSLPGPRKMGGEQERWCVTEGRLDSGPVGLILFYL